MTLITSPESDASVGTFGMPQKGQEAIDTFSYQQCSRQFTPLVLYPKADHMNQNHPVDSKHIFNQQDDPKTEKQVNHHLARINEMLEQNAKWWADQERIPPVTLSGSNIISMRHSQRSCTNIYSSYRRSYLRPITQDGLRSNRNGTSNKDG
jgi:hypothetical protein